MTIFKKRVPPPVYYDMVCDMLSALSFLDDNQVVHFDVKPQNILFTTKQHSVSGYIFQLADFGLAGKPPFLMNDVRGTPGYMAPEINREYSIMAAHQSEGTIRSEPPPTFTGKVDIWSLYVSLLSIMNVWSFHERLAAMGTSENGTLWPKECAEVELLVIQSTFNPEMSPFYGMAMLEPSVRTSAKAMIDIFSRMNRYRGESQRFLQYLRQVDELKKNPGEASREVTTPTRGLSNEKVQQKASSRILPNITPKRRQESARPKSLTNQRDGTDLPRADSSSKRSLGPRTDATRVIKSPKLKQHFEAEPRRAPSGTAQRRMRRGENA